jgi:DNA-directed RNA polymerase subunit M/transcription elongation factor TFIIS
MIFCPLCHNILLVQKSMSEMHFICPTCPYFHPVTSKVKKVLRFDNPIEDEIFGESKTDTTESSLR